MASCASTLSREAATFLCARTSRPDRPLPSFWPGICSQRARPAVAFTDCGAYRVPAKLLRIGILGNPKAAGGVHAILGMRPKAFAAAISSVTGDAFAPAKALGNVSTFCVRARTMLDTTSAVIASRLDRMRMVADAVHRVKRAAESGGSPVASKRPRLSFARRLG